MTDRRETNRKSKRRPKRSPKSVEPDWQDGERIAKYLARAGVASRREAEALIERGEVRVDGRKLTTPAFKVTGREDIRVFGKRVQAHEPVRVWRYHKPSGLITTTSDPEGRRTIFDELPKSLPRTITIGRLDLTTEGILLLTNDGSLARAMELPKTGFVRHYRARAHGEITQDQLDTLKGGITLDDGTRYTSIEAELERQTGTNNWINVRLTEGKNREVRKAMEHLGLQVNRLIRTQYGPFELGDLRPGAVEEIPAEHLRAQLSGIIPDKHLPAPPQERRPERRKPSGAARVHRRGR
ncbi:MAG: rRNA pseudouridine synthase [Hyphomonadaceae bacterium]|nr:rRNA pseudouridine synthase [Hyphomonadaceae bacterium]